MSAIDLNLSIQFTSDWHVGSGAGAPGDVDRLIRRDSAGLPFIPARTLSGIWRDAAETLAACLDAQGGGGYRVWVSALFGSQPTAERQKLAPPTPARLTIGKGSLAPELHRALASSPALRAATTFVAPGVAINPRTGAADEAKLFFTEYARTGAVLEARARVYLDGLDSEASETVAFIRAFLTAAAEGIQAMGGGRRRGKGRCIVRVQGEDGATLFERWGESAPPIPPRALDGEPPPTRTLATHPRSEALLRYEAAFELEQPLLAHLRTVGNTVECLDYAPAGLLLPEIARALRRCGADVGQLLRDGDLILTNLHPTTGDEASQTRLLPCPLSLYENKYGGDLEDRLVSGPGSVPLGQWKQQRSKWVTEAGLASGPSTELVRHAARKRLVSHSTIDDDFQRPTAAVGGVYTYEALAPGQTLVGSVAVRVGTPAAELFEKEKVQGALGEVIHLGRARKAGYGRGRLSLRKVDLPPPAVHGTTLMVWLLSPLVLRGPSGLPSTDPADLARALEPRVLKGGGRLQVDTGKTFVRTARFESWQSRWSLPRATLLALAPGSIVTLKATGGAIDAKALAQIQAEGIGQRTAEGFGEVLLNPRWERQTPEKVHRPGPGITPTVAAPTQDAVDLLLADDWGKIVLEAAAWAAINRAIACRPIHPEIARLGPSQRGALRTAAATAPRGELRGLVAQWREIVVTGTGPGDPIRGLADKIASLATGDVALMYITESAPAWFSALPPTFGDLSERTAQALIVDSCQRSGRALHPAPAHETQEASHGV